MPMHIQTYPNIMRGMLVNQNKMYHFFLKVDILMIKKLKSLSMLKVIPVSVCKHSRNFVCVDIDRVSMYVCLCVLIYFVNSVVDL